MTASQEQLDARIRIVTPENIAFEYEVAGPFARAPAYALDLAIRMGVFGIGALSAMLIFGVAGLYGMGMLLVFVLWFVLQWFYSGLFEAFRNGQTPGKRAMGLQVLRVDGRPVTPMQAVLRNLLKMLDVMPVVWIPGFFDGNGVLWYQTCLVGLVAMAVTPRRQRLGDLATGTMVVRVERANLAAPKTVEEPQIVAIAALLPANYAVSRSLARALSHYVGRRKYFGPGRKAELSRHIAAPLIEQLGLDPATDPDALACALYERTFHPPEGEPTPQRLVPVGR